LKAFEASIIYILDKEQPLHPATVEARNYILLARGGY
jgi:HD superfamily phosphohydrolase YqeK